MSDPFIAEVRIYGFNFPPRNWATCDGQVLPIAQNTALFSLLGTTYGGNGTTNFALPNLQGRAVMNPGQGPGLSPRQLGEVGGSATITLTANELPPHSHAVTVASSAVVAGVVTVADRANAAGNVLAKPTDSSYATGGIATAMNAGSTTSAGSNNPHNNMQPYLVLNFCIALFGVFPPRA